MVEDSDTPKAIMEALDVIVLYRMLSENGIEVRLDGGWAVDALLGRQTRPHGDLDIVVQHKDTRRLRALLEAQGYRDVVRDDTSAWNFVLGDSGGREIDVHAITFDNEGNGLYGPEEKGIMYPAASLTGTGTVNGHTVKCISAEWLVKFHSGYELDENDFRDVYALCERFGIDYPGEYAHPKKPE